MSSRLPAAIAAVFLSTAQVMAQETPSTGTAAIEEMAKVTAAADFIRAASMSDLFEIQSGQLAQTKAGSENAKALGKKLVDDHTAARQELMSLAQGAGVTAQPPESLDERHQKLIDQLTQATGTEFDKVFGLIQADAHREALMLFQSYAANGDNMQIKAFAMKGVPVLQAHLDMAEKIQAQ